MKAFSVAAILAIPLIASAIEITSPVPGIQWNSTGLRSVAWVNGPSDPSGFAMYLVYSNTIPPETILISSDVTTSDDKYSFDTALPAGTAKLQFTAAGNVTDILAESGEFTIVIGGLQACSSCTGVAASTAPPTASTAEAATTSQLLTGTAAIPKSNGNITHASRGFAVAVGMIVVGFTAMFFIA